MSTPQQDTTHIKASAEAKARNPAIPSARMAPEANPNILYAEIDDSGKIIGAPTDTPPEGKSYTMVSPGDEDEPFRTPTGAPITDNMNPAHSLIDPALQARNPVRDKPGEPETKVKAEAAAKK